MMVAALILGRLKRRAECAEAPPLAEEAPAEPWPINYENQLVILLPTPAGLSFHALHFPGLKPAAQYFRQQTIFPKAEFERAIAFWALNPARRPPRMPGAAGDAEAIILRQQAGSRGIVELVSFVEMDSARAFAEHEAAAPHPDESVQVYWAVTVPVDAILGPGAGEQSAAPAAEHPPSHARAAPAATRAPAAAAAAAPRTAEAEPPAESPAPSLLGRAFAALRDWQGWSGLAPLLRDALMLKEDAYESVRSDPHAPARAALIVGAGALASATGAAGAGPVSALLHLPAAIIGWAAYAAAVYVIAFVVIGARSGPETLPRLMGVLGLAFSPALLLWLGLVPTYGPLFVLGIHVWVLAATYVAGVSQLQLHQEPALAAAAAATLTLFAFSQVAPLLLV